MNKGSSHEISQGSPKSQARLLTIPDVLQITQLGRTTLYELMRCGSLPYLKIGRSVRIRREALEEWLDSLD